MGNLKADLHLTMNEKFTPWSQFFCSVSSFCLVWSVNLQNIELAAVGITNGLIGVYVNVTELKAKEDRERLIAMMKGIPTVIKTQSYQPTRPLELEQPAPTPATAVATPAPQGALQTKTLESPLNSRKRPMASENPKPRGSTQTERRETPKFRQLALRLQGDRDKARRLVEYEQAKHPDQTWTWCITRAIEQLERDRM